jgi:hypothetical protein
MDFTNTTRFYMNLDTAPYSTFNDSISSLWVGPDAKVRICNDKAMSGYCISQNGAPGGYSMNVTGPVSECDCNQTPFCCSIDNVTSIRVDKITDNCSLPGLAQVAIFENPNYQGDCVVLNKGNYYSATANPTSGQTGGGWGMRDNSISSVIIGVPGAGHNFWFWDNPNQTGTNSYYSGAQYTPALSAFGFDNKASSLAIN